MTELRKTEFYLEVAKGNVPGHSAVNKFGHSPNSSSGDDVWGGSGAYTFYPTAGVLVDIVSTDVDDNGTGTTGALTVMVQGLDENWMEAEETVTLNGTTPVTTMTTTFSRLFRAFVLTAGSTGTNEGDITVYARSTGSGVTAGDVGIHITTNHGQTQQAIYTIPAGKSAYFIKGYVGMKRETVASTQSAVDFNWLMRPFGGAWLVQGEIGLTNLGSNWWQYEYGVPAGPIPEKTDIRIEAAEISDSMDCVGGFDLILVDD